MQTRYGPKRSFSPIAIVKTSENGDGTNSGKSDDIGARAPKA
jgi:hypothetical protein